MEISNESLVIILIVGLVAGWLSGQLIRGAGFGVVGDIIIGIVGALFGTWLLPQLGVRIGSGLVNTFERPVAHIDTEADVPHWHLRRHDLDRCRERRKLPRAVLAGRHHCGRI